MQACPQCASLVIEGRPCPHCARPGVSIARSFAVAAVALGLVGSGTACIQSLYGAPVVDDDGDGYEAGFDCDDSDPDVNPAAPEVPGNGVDDDCDGTVDEGDA